MANEAIRRQLRDGDALIVVDVQPDFCPGGKLGIDDGDSVIPVLNDWIDAAQAEGVPIYASRDWHPAHHVSFEESGGPWPEHCVQDTPGAQFHPDLKLPDSTVKISKGVRLDKDQYSAFDDTGLADYLKDKGVERVWIGGLAEDVCVHATVLDACKAGFETHLIPDATRPVTPEGGEKARREMEEAGAKGEAA
jgi:nicotinamidase/pyrazinamidase